MSDKCERCGNMGQDRRTLWMACFYQMNELSIPFKQIQLADAAFCNQTDSKPSSFPGPRTPVFEPADDNRADRIFYILRVCKRCRGEWLAAQQAWYDAPPQYEDHDAEAESTDGCGSGIFVRRHGAVIEISREEWDCLHPGEEPVICHLAEDGTK